MSQTEETIESPVELLRRRAAEEEGAASEYDVAAQNLEARAAKNRRLADEARAMAKAFVEAAEQLGARGVPR